MNRFVSTGLSMAAMLAAMISLASCGFQSGGSGGNPAATTPQATNLLSQGSVNHQATSQGQLVTVHAMLHTGAMQMQAGSLAVMDPRSGAHVGQLAVSQSQNGQSAVQLVVNVSAVAQTPGSTAPATMPNGSALPLSSNVNPASVVTLPAGNSGSQVFLSLVHGLLGVAMLVPQFQGIAAAANIMLPLLFGDGSGNGGLLSGLGGLFSGSQSGVSFFTDISGILSQLGLIPAAPSSGSTVSTGTSSSSTASGSGTASNVGSSFGSGISGILGIVGNVINGVLGVFNPTQGATSGSTTGTTTGSTSGSTSGSGGTALTPQVPSTGGLSTIESFLSLLNSAASILHIL